MSWNTAGPPAACALPSAYRVGLSSPARVPFSWFSIATRPAHAGAAALVPAMQHFTAPPCPSGYTADAARETSGTARRLVLSPFCHTGRASLLLPPPLASLPSCHTTSLPYDEASSGDGENGVVPPTAVTKGDWANRSTPRTGFGAERRSGPKSPEAFSTDCPWGAACLKSFSACRMSGAVCFEGSRTTDKLITETSGRFTR